MRLIRVFSPLVFIVFTHLLAAATYAPKTLVFTGADEYKSVDLMAVTSLTPGKQVTSEQIDAAMQRLVDTGFFSDMRYTVNDRALTITLTPVPADQLLEVKYKNFVWWSDAELTSLVHARIPLFTGRVPVTGIIKDGVAGALTEILAGKSVKASVSSVPIAKLGSEVTGRMFMIDDPLVQVGAVQVDRVTANAATKVADVKTRFAGQDYDSYSSGPALQQNVKDAYLDLGYLDIAVDTPVRGMPQVGSSAIVVSLATAVHEGTVYHLSKIDSPESQILSKAAFAEASQLKAGDLASRIVLMRTELSETVRFQGIGYLDAKISVTGQKDESAHEIAYAFSVLPGEQYRVASVKTPNLTPEQQAEFDKVWKLAPGQFYNDEPIRSALQKLASNRAFQGYSPKLDRDANPQSHLVVIKISFVKGSRPS